MIRTKVTSRRLVHLRLTHVQRRAQQPILAYDSDDSSDSETSTHDNAIKRKNVQQQATPYHHREVSSQLIN